MDCNHIEAMFSAYYDGGATQELNSKEEKAFEDHLATCPHCMAQYKEYVNMLRAVASLSPPPMPENLHDTLMGYVTSQTAKNTLAKNKGKAPPVLSPLIESTAKKPQSMFVKIASLTAVAASIVVALFWVLNTIPFVGFNGGGFNGEFEGSGFAGSAFNEDMAPRGRDFAMGEDVMGENASDTNDLWWEGDYIPIARLDAEGSFPGALVETPAENNWLVATTISVVIVVFIAMVVIVMLRVNAGRKE